MEGKANRASREEAERLAGYTKEEHEEAAGMPLEPAFMAKGYYGHELGCDCAVCESMMLGEARRKREAEHRKNILRLGELVIAAYFRGWKDGSETGESDSPDWNAAEDWVETDIRQELTKIEAALEI